MSKDKISDYSATANSNTDIGGINIDEGCAPSGINDAIRTLMKQLKDWQSGSQDVYIHPAGSASVPSITATGDTNTGIFFPAADTVGITTGGTERARIDSSGNFGVGTTSSLGKVHASSSSFGGSVSSNANQLIAESSGNAGVTIATGASSLGNIFFADSGDSADGYIQYDQSGRSMRFGTATAEKMRLDSSGNLGLGVTPSAWATFKVMQIGNGTADTFIAVSGNQGDFGVNAYYNAGWKYQTSSVAASRYEQSSGVHQWFNAPSGTAGNAITFTQAMTLDASGNLGIGATVPANYGKLAVVGTVAPVSPDLSLQGLFSAANTGEIRVGGYKSSGGTYLVFSTGADAERARIDSSGNLLVGTTTQLGSAKATFKAGSTLPAISIGMANSSGTYAAQIFFDGDNTDSGSIDVNNDANTTAYTTSSDYRLKINVQPISNALYKVSQLNPVTWNWKKNPSLGSSGFIAHELQDVCPDAVTGHKDDVDADGNPVYQGVDTSFLVATLTAAIQEQQAIITQLQADVAALKG